jgi:hypothetical protein
VSGERARSWFRHLKNKRLRVVKVFLIRAKRLMALMLINGTGAVSSQARCDRAEVWYLEKEK